METKEGVKTFHATSGKEWRRWLAKHHLSEKSVWLIIYRKESGTPSIYYPEAVDQALCFGWIDSKPNKRDDKSYYQFFARRKPTSNWSRINKEKVASLMEQGLMEPAGLRMVEIAKQNGTWTALDEVENITLPADMEKEFGKNKKAKENWDNFSRSSKRGILEWILNAKRPETRERRITQTVTLAAKNIKANHPG